MCTIAFLKHLAMLQKLQSETKISTQLCTGKSAWYIASLSHWVSMIGRGSGKNWEIYQSTQLPFVDIRGSRNGMAFWAN